ncbi:Glyoxalase/Bleomycin resistance protein/Dihydroxybiphenyl dioxygenase [Xylariaceae sp. FL0804]|nr:Glyoxalase/Bleomycin resistance protein/Dihydroxybiphenyl dioxygenase [Xylariaceae sp. FL0804]
MASTTDTKNYKFNHSMLRVKDPKESGKYRRLLVLVLVLVLLLPVPPFYEFLGMSVVKKLSFPDAKFDLYFLAYDHPSSLTFDREGVIELTHNYGTEHDPNFTVNNGNAEPHRGFGHVCVSVDHIRAACERLERAGYRFQKRLADGRMKSIAFALDPDGYWVEIVSRRVGSRGADDPEEEGKETDPSTYRMNHTMVRVKDSEKSLKFYQEVLGMSLFRTVEQSGAGFNLYFLGYPGASAKSPPSAEGGSTADYEGLLELTWNYGTEKDEAFHYHDGNAEPQGFGHICISVDNLEAACSRFESLKCNWKKRLTDGRMKNVAFLLDPDGYWIEIVQNERFTKQENF